MFKSKITEDKSRCLKFNIVGDANTGKTSLLQTYLTKKFPEESIPTVFDSHHVNIQVDDDVFPVTLWDTSGLEQYVELRPLAYPKTDCFLVCYSVDNPVSFSNLKDGWIPEVREHCPNAAVMLVGTKLDLIEPGMDSLIPINEVKKLKSRINAQAFMECSAKSQENVKDIFIEAVKVSISWNNPNSTQVQRCILH